MTKVAKGWWYVLETSDDAMPKVVAYMPDERQAKAWAAVLHIANAGSGKSYAALRWVPSAPREGA